MGRKVEFSDQQIIETGKAIAKTGQTVSPFSIRNVLKGGSSERIKRVWEHYIEEQKQLEVQMASVELPLKVRETLGNHLKLLEKQLTDLTKDSFSLAQQDADSRIMSTIEALKEKICTHEDSEQEVKGQINSATLPLLQRQRRKH